MYQRFIEGQHCARLHLYISGTWFEAVWKEASVNEFGANESPDL